MLRRSPGTDAIYVYRARICPMLIPLLLSVGCTTAFAITIWRHPPPSVRGAAIVLALMLPLALLAILWLATLFRWRLTITPHSVDVVTAFGHRTIPTTAITARYFDPGFKGGPGSDILDLKDGAGRSLRILRVFRPDRQYLKWLARIPRRPTTELLTGWR